MIGSVCCLLYTSKNTANRIEKSEFGGIPDTNSLRPLGHSRLNPEVRWVTGHRDCLEPVSYTHLDVYKRQEYGTIRLFDQMEREEIDGQLSLFTGAEMAELSHMETAAAVVADCTAVAVAADSAAVAVRTAAAEGAIHGKEAEPESDQPAPGLNLQQEAAVTAIGRAINVVAGPGTGKTKTLVSHEMCIRDRVIRKVNHENWEHINRISFWVYADMPGFRSISFRMQFLSLIHI